MKKAILTIGLFSLVMVLTSFTSNEEITSTTKNDNKAEVFKIENVQLNLAGNGSTSQGNKKMD
ncbi:hypothetical protein EKM05_08815 [Flavobacterium sp. GSP27]|uniref:Uncharacterized protein n=1 Tax=Flavobacterium bomense TaxID=2497483 RepID=A0A3S0PGX5_9FLAO|nr:MULTISPECIES: hypothetical protein [Flavobacterium]RTY93802.1 hypothetical protein EKL32_14515 [Flavobacterium sp. GSN2]RTY73697.1 hypothetical protein EKL96_10195 [Flavobacterium sp. LS1R10]RTY90456.1 hypothetical protein EKM01_11040 [Flavobacterium sp. RSP46]RTZ02630.1 hypothetical protein EKL98_13215 [Flavobacterium bomense]RTZ05445.1 hypothetical protein EKM03_09450 [Flavobacterium sp. GSP6]